MSRRDQVGEKKLKIRPLTKRAKDGQLYERSQEIESQILAVLELTHESLLDRARVRDHNSPDFLSEECLIYLIGEYQRQSEEYVVMSLIEILFRRCARFITNRLRSLDPQLAEEAYSDVTAGILDLALDVNSNRGDFMQVRFWVVLERITISTYNRHRTQQLFSRMTVPFSMTGSHSNEDEDDLHGGIQEVDVPDISISPEKLVIYQEGLNAVEEPSRTAFILRCHGWPIESKDPNELTISRYLGKTPRTIRNWLAAVDEKLQYLQAEKD